VLYNYKRQNARKKKELTWCGEAELKTMTGRFSWADMRWLYRRCCWRLLTGEWLGRWPAFLLLLLCVFFLLLCSPLFLFSSSVSHGAVAGCAVMALKAVLLVVADRRMAWTVVGLSSSSSLHFFFSCSVLLCFCFLLLFLTVLLSCVLRWRLLAGGVAVGGDGGSSPLCAEA
jgi:hypothetical protein